MNKINLYYHAGSGNHGCEAIVRSTNKILVDSITLHSLRVKEDKQYNLNSIIDLSEDVTCKVIKPSLKYYISAIEIKLLGSSYLETFFSKNKLIKEIKKNDIAFSIGGDNYCYPGYETLSNINYILHKKGAKTVLWGCSIEPSILQDKRTVEDMKRYNLITVRETLSQQGLFDVGVKDNVFLFPDPAFQLDEVDLPLPSNFIEGNTVGINVSPLIMSCETNVGITRENYIQLINYIIDHTDMNIALIPHVVWENNDDRIPLQELYDLFKRTNRVCLIDDHNCMELKGYISRCRLFVGARTHATIAAYSTCVPTLVVGYSIKAKGIAKDIFGTYDNYVLPVQSLKEKNDLTIAFKWIIENEDHIRNHLNGFMAQYKEKALEAGEEVRKLLD